MNIAKRRFAFVFSLVFLSQLSFAQSGSGSNYLLYALIGIGLVLLVFAILTLADNLIQIEGKKAGIDPNRTNIGLFPKVADMFSKKAPTYMDKGDGFKSLTKGFDIKLRGEATGDVTALHTSRYALKPTDFNGMSPIPKVLVAAGDEVKAGDAIFFDKKRPEIMYSSPVSGEVVEVKRGAKRSIAEIIILADKEISYKSFEAPNLDTADREGIVSFMLESGTWSLLNQRPFDMVPDQTVVPRDIFISTFDTAPLAIDNSAVITGNESVFQKGLDVLGKLTSGSVYLGLDGRAASPVAGFSNATGVKKNYFSGQHPAGNVGIQIHNTAPIKGSDIVWTLGVQEVIAIGRLFAEGKYDGSRYVAVTGGHVTNPGIIKTYQGASIGDILEGNLSNEKSRIIAGNVLTGQTATSESFLGFKDNQITVITENDEYEPFGWLLPLAPRPSISGTFPNFLFKNFKFEGETNTHGEKRAFVVTGQYESVLPMDIYPQHLMKAIMAGDFEKMEGLGINELSEEDIALCEFVCTSKMPLQSILREGLDMMREQA